MTAFVETGTTGPMGIVTLNRPEAINALTLDMIGSITDALSDWQASEAIRAVLIEGRGERGFCAGGDVRAVRSAVLAGRPEEGLAFFEAEYALNALISRFGKPVVALTHGVVMGGGIGLAGHAHFRFTAFTSRFAMPEGAIGFVPDVGVNFILGKAPAHRALHVLMTGETIGPADALKLGLTDCVIADDRLGAVRERILSAAGSGDIQTALIGVMQSELADPGPAEALALADTLADLYGHDGAANIVRAMTDAAALRPEVKPVLALIRKRCPTSLAAAVESYCISRRALDVTEVLARDLRLARYMAQRDDFSEGVRAVLVDKDQRPQWRPASLADVDIETIDALAGAPAGALA